MYRLTEWLTPSRRIPPIENHDRGVCLTAYHLIQIWERRFVKMVILIFLSVLSCSMVKCQMSVRIKSQSYCYVCPNIIRLSIVLHYYSQSYSHEDLDIVSFIALMMAALSESCIRCEFNPIA